MFAQCLLHNKRQHAETRARANAQPGEHVTLSVQIAIHQMIARVQVNVDRFRRFTWLGIKRPIAAWYIGLGPEGTTLKNQDQLRCPYDALYIRIIKSTQLSDRKSDHVIINLLL